MKQSYRGDLSLQKYLLLPIAVAMATPEYNIRPMNFSDIIPAVKLSKQDYVAIANLRLGLLRNAFGIVSVESKTGVILGYTVVWYPFPDAKLISPDLRPVSVS